jgi:S-adenosylmethionine synthetase
VAGEIAISALPDPEARPIELVERKGIGHPDTICDALAERFSLALSRFYVERFGAILHHNVDKVLLAGGASRPRFRGGEVVEPIEIYLAGRATRTVKGVEVPVEELAIASGRAFFREAFHLLDPERHVRFHCLVRPGSQELVDLFLRQSRTGTWMANDSSIGVGFAPLSRLEQSVLDIDRALGTSDRPAVGEDTKILAIAQGGRTALTVACALCDRHVADLAAYEDEIGRLAARVAEGAADGAEIAVNAADDRRRGDVYLTVTGSSAEAGDDGEAGRGNRANGLITPGRPMTMESVAGKNPVSHVGKLYNLAARAIAGRVVREVPAAKAAECYLASRIGRPVAEPQLAHVRIAPRDGRLPPGLERAVEPIVAAELARLDGLWRSLLDGTVKTF